MHKVAGFLTSEHFYEPVHGKIFEHAMTVIERGQHATPVTLKTYFERDEALSEVGGAAWAPFLAAFVAKALGPLRVFQKFGDPNG